VIEFLLGGTLGSTGSLRWSGSSEEVLLASLLAVIALGAAAWTGRGQRSRAGRIAELASWALCLGLLVISLAKPSWVEESGREEPGRFVVLIDGSRSMGVRELSGERGKQVAEIMDELPAGADVYTFGADLHAGAPAEWSLGATDLGAALATVADRYLGQPVQGMAVITDGIDRGGLRREAMDPGVTDFRAPALPGPVTFYQVGRATALQDLAVDEVITGGFAFLRTPFTLEARVRGEPGLRTSVTLTREGRHVAEEAVLLDEQGKGSVRFEVRPTRVGRGAWEVSVPVRVGDAVPGNNTYPVVIRVVRDRTRVLQVSGSPSYDQKFLRLFLKEDPSVDLVSFFILRTHEDFGAGWRSSELSLIAFPYERLFSEDLSTFDLVVLQNFNYRPYFNRDSQGLLQNIADYVKKGGALVMIGGDRAFDLGDYAGTPIAEVLPVKLGVTGPKSDPRPFVPELTEAGRIHPLTRLESTLQASADTWEQLPEMDGLNLTRGLKADSALLLGHPTMRTGGQPMPVAAVREVGKGRTMALMVDGSWRWSFSQAAQGHGNQAYLRFWKQSLRWLVADPDDRRVVVSPSRENVLLGEEVQVRVRVRDSAYGAVDERAVEGSIIGPGGTAESFELQTDASGEAVMTYTPTARGAHRVVVTAGAGAADRSESVFSVSARDPELAEIVPDRAFLERLAEAYGEAGAYREPGQPDAPLLDSSATRQVHDRKQTSLSASPLIALMVGFLGTLTWWLRRREGAR
jgi:uncharacterized membrane protein/nitrogen fixation protein FixH